MESNKQRNLPDEFIFSITYKLIKSGGGVRNFFLIHFRVLGGVQKFFPYKFQSRGRGLDPHWPLATPLDVSKTLASIDCLKSNPRILALIGEAFYFSGDYDRAYHYLKRSFDIYPFMKQGIQKYALLCDMFKKPQELEQMLRPSFPFALKFTDGSLNF